MSFVPEETEEMFVVSSSSCGASSSLSSIFGAILVVAAAAATAVAVAAANGGALPAGAFGGSPILHVGVENVGGFEGVGVTLDAFGANDDDEVAAAALAISLFDDHDGVAAGADV